MIAKLLTIFLAFPPLALGNRTFTVASLYGQGASDQYVPLPISLQSSVSIYENREIKRARIYFQDIAECSGSVLLCREILAIDLGPSPKPGQQRILREAEIRNALDAELPGQKIEIHAPSSIRIVATALPVDSLRIREQVDAILTDIEGPYRFFLMNVRVPIGLRLRHDNYRVEFPSWRQDFNFIRQNPRRALVNLMVRLIDQEPGSSEQFDLTAQVVLRAEVQAAVVTKAMERGQPVIDGVAFQWVPYQENVIREAPFLERQLLRSTARPGQILRVYDLIRDPDVKRGERVEASVVSNGVKMNSSAQAMESATVGQRIRIKLETTKRQVMATVIAPSKVEVHMP